MSDDEELKIKKIFNKYDKNGDGWISRGEWYDVVHKFLGDRDAAWILAEVPAREPRSAPAPLPEGVPQGKSVSASLFLP